MALSDPQSYAAGAAALAVATPIVYPVVSRVAYRAYNPIASLLWIVVTLGRRDPQRLYSREQKQQLYAIAGGRCEHKPMLWFRCARRSQHADHIIPWSKGGRTTVANGQHLCATHNLSKSNKMPTPLYVWRLRMRRRRYSR